MNNKPAKKEKKDRHSTKDEKKMKFNGIDLTDSSFIC
jgi:hypothetical protein